MICNPNVWLEYLNRFNHQLDGKMAANQSRLEISDSRVALFLTRFADNRRQTLDWLRSLVISEWMLMSGQKNEDDH